MPLTAMLLGGYLRENAEVNLANIFSHLTVSKCDATGLQEDLGNSQCKTEVLAP